MGVVDLTVGVCVNEVVVNHDFVLLEIWDCCQVKLEDADL